MLGVLIGVLLALNGSLEQRDLFVESTVDEVGFLQLFLEHVDLLR